MDPLYLYFTDDLILLDENISNNEESENGLYQTHVNIKIMNRDNTPRRPGLRILPKYRGVNSKISLALIRNIKVGRDEGDDDNHDIENPFPARRLISITSLVFYGKERANIGRANRD